MTVPVLKDIYNYECTLCPLHSTANYVCLPSSGRKSLYPAMVVGEAPGRLEDIEGMPFIGRSGWLLDRVLKAAFSSDQARAEVVVTNAVKCRSPDNDLGNTDINVCVSTYLTREIEALNATVLLALGNVAASALLSETGVTRLRGTWHRLDSIIERWVMVTYHPSYVLRHGLDSSYHQEFKDDVDAFAVRAIARGGE